MTVMAAVALGGLFSACSSEIEDAQVGNTEFDIVKNYEDAFIARFGQPHENQTWGFGSEAGTRAVVATPYVQPSVKTYNAQMCLAWQGVKAAEATGTVETTFDDMNTYVAWEDKGWNDQFYDVHGTVESSTISEELIAAFANVIVGTEEKPGLIPENVNNLAKAQSTGYSIVTTGGPVTLTPIYHYSNSGDRLSYYYYPVGSKPSVEEIKTMKKYSLGNMSDPQHNGDTHFYRNTYSLVYEDANGNCSYTFPKDYVINFVISNTWNDYAGNKDKIYQEGGITSTTGGSEPTQTTVDKYAITAGQTIQCGDEVNAPNNKLRIKFSKPNPSTTTTSTTPQFAKTQEGSSFYMWGNEFKYYYPGNGVNGNLNGGSTCYYLKANTTGYLAVGVHLNGGTIKVYNIGTDWDGTANIPVTPEETPQSNDGVCGFPVTSGNVYAVYAENGQLGYYGYTLFNSVKDAIIEANAVPNDWGPDDIGTVYNQSYWNYSNIHLKVGKETITTPGEPIYFNTATAGDGNHPIAGYPAYTAGTNNNGGYNPGSTIYFIRPTEAGILRVAVKVSENKKFHVEDLGEWGWYNTSGTTLISEIKDASNSYYGTYDINAEANHVYAVYAEGSKLGFFGCELIQVTPGEAGITSTSNVVWKEIPRTPDYYSDGDLNTEIHSTSYGYGVGGYGVTDTHTSHTAVFKSTVNNIDYTFIGFEDWIDFDYNDLVFAVTGTKPEKPQDPIVIPDPGPDPTPTEPDDIVCRIIVEDLSVSERSDFDFNDVVFDVCHNGTLIIRAIGGELPIYIGAENTNEVHEACSITLPDNFNNNHGQNSHKVMRNTGWQSSGDSKVYEGIDYHADLGHIVLSRTFNTPADALDIGIWVHKNGKNVKLKAPRGKVASMVCVGTDYEWCAERQDIDEKYHKNGVKLFHQYVIGDPDYQGDWKDKDAWYHKMNQ